MNIKLVVVQGKPQGKEIPLRCKKFLIGRGAECHLRPNSELVSRHHCMLIVQGGSVSLRELGSTNGTKVNGQRVYGDVAVCPEDLIQVGPLAFRLVIESVPVPVLPAPQPLPAPAIAALAAAVGNSSHSGNPPLDPTGDIHEWLDSIPRDNSDEGSTVHNKSVDDLTRSDRLPAPEQPPATQPEEEVVHLTNGATINRSPAKGEPAKPREDATSPGGILRRVIEHRTRQ